MASGDIVGSSFKDLVKENVKFDFPVAEDVGIGGAPSLVFAEHVVDHPFPVVFAQVDDPEGDVQFFGDHFRNQGVVFPGAGAGKGTCTVVPIDHKESRNLMSLLFQQECGHTGIYST